MADVAKISAQQEDWLASGFGKKDLKRRRSRDTSLN